MKNIHILILLTLLLPAELIGQQMRGIDKSPMDMAYFPDDFAHDIRFAPEELEFDRPIIRVIYSRPALKGRKILGELIPYDKVWRVGANEAPEIRFYEDMTFGGKKVEAGDYALLSIAGLDSWTLILSKDVDQWGTYSYSATNDVVRVRAEISEADESVENFTIQFEGKGKQVKAGTMHMAWGNSMITVPFSF